MLLVWISSVCYGQRDSYLSSRDLQFLKQITKDVLDSSRIHPGQRVSSDFGENTTGGILIRPGGRNSYPSFWIRDYAMSLESGLISLSEQKHMLYLTAKTQCDQTWITPMGSYIPVGAIADHIRIDDSKPIYFPGTYSYEQQGGETFGLMPPYSDQFFFIHMAYYYAHTTGSVEFLHENISGMRLMDRLELAFKVPPTLASGDLVYTTDSFRAVDFGFRDVITMTGNLAYPSILKYRASVQLAFLFERLEMESKSEKYRSLALRLKKSIPKTFMDDRGMLLASTSKSNQPDVWSTALALYFGILEGEERLKTSAFLARAYEKGYLTYKGNIRHILITDDYSESTAWQYSLAQKQTYQNGAYWGTPVGWVCYAIGLTDEKLAQRLAKEYTDELRENDFRKGGNKGAPYECFHPNGNEQNPVYLTSVSCPLAVFENKISWKYEP